MHDSADPTTRIAEHSFRLSVVIPVYNERNTIAQVVERVRSVDLPIEVIIVDDGSTDGTRDVLRQFANQVDVVVILQEINQGKGTALKTGFQRATGEIIVVQDADLEYDPADLPRVIEPIVAGRADVVYGSRFSSLPSNSPFSIHTAGNRMLTRLSNFRTGLKLTDMETCYKAFRREILQQITPTLQEARFGIEPELTAKIARVPNIRVMEIPISYAGRSYAEGKKIGLRDGFRALWCIMRY